MDGVGDDHAYDENRERQEAESEMIRAAYSPEEAWVTVVATDGDAGVENDGRGICGTSSVRSVRRYHRRLDLPILGDGDSSSNSGNSGNRSSQRFIPVELVLTLPPSYPTEESAVLRVDASLISPTRNATTPTSVNKRTTARSKPPPAAAAITTTAVAYRKRAIDALPYLLRVCRMEASEYAGSETAFLVLSRADRWIDEEWPGYMSASTLSLQVGRDESSIPVTAAAAAAAAGTTGKENPQSPEPVSNLSNSNNDDDEEPPPSPPPPPSQSVLLGRKLIYSHHIIAKSKRRAIGDLAKAYKLGGYYKIGWPGIIVLEGREEDCRAFYDEIRSMRWQHLALRGEEQEVVAVSATGAGASSVDDLRRFPKAMTELGENEMSRLSEICRGAGLENLFLTSMKIYKDGTGGGNDDGEGHDGTKTKDIRFGTLLLVDHMNDPKRYTKWIQKACKSAGCVCLILRCVPNNNTNNESDGGSRRQTSRRAGARPMILVGLTADDESSIRQVLKRWRTTRVDVDSSGNPCLERMMDVLVETGPLESSSPLQNATQGDSSSSTENCGDRTVTQDESETALNTIGGSSWVGAFRDAAGNRQNSASSKISVD